MEKSDLIIADILAERVRQEWLCHSIGKFRFTCAAKDWPHVDKLPILIEETGEVAKAVLENGKAENWLELKTAQENLRCELIQVAAVAIAWLESIYSSEHETKR